jgi:hypothetical protein
VPYLWGAGRERHYSGGRQRYGATHFWRHRHGERRRVGQSVGRRSGRRHQTRNEPNFRRPDARSMRDGPTTDAHPLVGLYSGDPTRDGPDGSPATRHRMTAPYAAEAS